MTGLGTLRGQGPAPAGYFKCYDPKCPARRDPCSGRFTQTGHHYHRVLYQPKPTVTYECPRCGHRARFAAIWPGPACGPCLGDGHIETMKAKEVAK